MATLLHLQLVIERVLDQGVRGHLIEAGVFRGGGTILMRGVCAAHGADDRRIFVADSFAGIPPSRRPVADGLAEECDDWGERYAVSDQVVRRAYTNASFEAQCL